MKQWQVKEMCPWGPSGRETDSDHGHSGEDHKVQTNLKQIGKKKKNINI